MIRHVTIQGTEYYEVYDPLTNSVGDIFTDWRDIPAQRAKLMWQTQRAKAIKQKLTRRCETMR